MRIETKLIHAGEAEPKIAGSVTMPIFQSSTFEHGGGEGQDEVRYIRLNNTPNHLALGQRIAALEETEAALVTGSGMAAISSALFAFLQAGDHVVAHRALYGGTHGLFTGDLPRFGIHTTFVDAGDVSAVRAAIRPETKVVYVETMTNPLCEVVDLRGVAALAREAGVISMIDNTFASPVNFRPATVGFDLVLHSASKYLNGHSDLVAGAVAGSAAHVEAVKHKLDHFGGTLDPHACFLLSRGMRTLALRVRQQNQSALALSRWLSERHDVARVSYPGLERDPSHARAKALFAGAGGLFAFELTSAEAARRFLGKVHLATAAPSLGGTETLVTQPRTTSHRLVPEKECLALGITPGLVRVSVGLEAVEDLIEDFDQALQ